MRRSALRKRVATLLFGVVASVAHAAELTPEAIYRQAAPSVVTVYAASHDGGVANQASGVVVRPHYVMTNCHVLKGGDFAGVKAGGATITAELVEVRLNYDLCLLHAALLDAPPLVRRSTRDLRVGQRVYALGAPLGLELTFTEGLVSGLRPEHGYVLIQTSAAVSPGSSGGALLTQDGGLVGIVSFKLGDETGHSENLNFAMPIDLLDEFRTLPR